MTGGLNNPRPVDDTPVNGQLEHGVTSNRMFDHEADIDAHMVDILQTLRTGQYHVGGADRLNTGASALTANRLRAVPFIAVRDMTVDRIALAVSVLADPSNIRLGIYNNGTNLYPGTLLLDAGLVSGATTGVKPVVINQALTKGLYWLVLLADDTPTVVTSTPVIGILGVLATDFGYYNMTWDVAQAYGALPNPFTAGGTALYYEHFTMALRVSSLD